MDREEALELIDQLDGDELSWVDFKQDYEIGGIAEKKAEFIKDVGSLANTLSGNEERYILVGCDDDGNIVGYDESRENYRGAGPRHIISLDESDMQEWISDHLEPAPEIEFRTFQQGDCSFGVLVVRQVGSPPTIVKRDLYDSNNNLFLHQGRFHIRRGSGKKIGTHEDLERIVQHRIDSRRDEILDGVEKAVHLGPEFIEQLSSLTGSDALGSTASGDAQLEFRQRLSRDPATSLDQELNEDIVRTAYRDDDYAEAVPTWRYYASPSSLTLDEEACRYLYNCGLTNGVLGTLWLSKLSEDEAVSAIPDIPNDRTRGHRAAKIAFLRGSEELLTNIGDAMMYGESPTTRSYRDQLDWTPEKRFRHLLESKEYRLVYEDWSKSFEPEQLDKQECREKIHAVADQLEGIEDALTSNPGIRGVRNDFRNAVHDLELQLARKVWELEDS